MTEFVDELISAQKETKRLKDFSPLQKIIVDQLIVFTSPGAMVNPHIFKRTELKGWATEKDWRDAPDWMNSTQWKLYELTYYLKPLPKSPLIVLNKKPCESFAPPNENCPDPNKLGWFNRWVVYPGDFLCDTYGACQVQPAERTLIYYSHDGKNDAKIYYFGLRPEKGHWVLHSIYMEDTAGHSGV